MVKRQSVCLPCLRGLGGSERGVFLSWLKTALRQCGCRLPSSQCMASFLKRSFASWLVDTGRVLLAGRLLVKRSFRVVHIILLWHRMQVSCTLVRSHKLDINLVPQFAVHTTDHTFADGPATARVNGSLRRMLEKNVDQLTMDIAGL
jgi:hypothetical protein